jgi:hypothetical protein
MYLGRFTIGQEIVLPLHATDAAPSAVVAVRAPGVKVFDLNGTLVLADSMPALDTVRSVGLFCYRLVPSATFAVGRYVVVFSYSENGNPRCKTAHFDIVAGGDPSGAVNSMYQLERPQARHVVVKTDAGKRLFKRSPYL